MDTFWRPPLLFHHRSYEDTICVVYHSLILFSLFFRVGRRRNKDNLPDSIAEQTRWEAGGRGGGGGCP